MKFGVSAGTSVSCASTTQCTATSPAGSGTIDVTVTTAGGTSATSAADHFTYVPAPVVTSIRGLLSDAAIRLVLVAVKAKSCYTEGTFLHI